MLSRRTMIAATGAALVAAPAIARAAPPPPPKFVTVDGTGFRIGNAPYRYAGANPWYGAYLGADAAYGDRARLRRELDALADLGITNLRVLGASEQSPLKNSLDPVFHAADGSRNETLLAGLDFLLAEMAQRDMRAVIYLSNFWEWSGGFVTYLYWTNGGHYIDMNDPAHPWPEFPDLSAQFYASAAANALYRDYVRALVTRTNTITGVAYADDPAIMAWQLANEPRPGGSDAAVAANMPAFLAWIGASAEFIKALDPNHLVSTGSEGVMGCAGANDKYLLAHQSGFIDYLTCHIWPQNWGWVDANDLAGTYAQGEAKALEYLNTHIDVARTLNKPLVVEEFGFPRDGGGYEPGTATTLRDRFYAAIYARVLDSAKSNGPLAGSNFWTWAGSGRARHADHRARSGETAYAGDPPHEPQGWYSVFDADKSTLALICEHARALNAG